MQPVPILPPDGVISTVSHVILLYTHAGCVPDVYIYYAFKLKLTNRSSANLRKLKKQKNMTACPRRCSNLCKRCAASKLRWTSCERQTLVNKSREIRVCQMPAYTTDGLAQEQG